jgi:hypothetical protein
MADCEKISACPFFNDKLAAMPDVTTMMKNRYCRGDKTKCARYVVSTAGGFVPPDLFPHERDRVGELLRRRA